ncbi:type VII secretion protein EccB [Blastococcus sp. Marseille-P5729]|uniref:type VII secretion protein EccB n=1 Tax=Blastococcus sp. Marseille-P5729 TaxID=2086582 RepID=UPI00131B9A29|nr:type VII secretion protein EccB [Blastococcus sp. Marseille-P5729]
MTSQLRASEASRFGRRRLRTAIAGPAPRGGIAALVVAGLLAAALLVNDAVRSRSAVPSIEDGAVVLTEHGELYLVEDGIAHPLPNVTSARLLADQVRSVPGAAIEGLPRGRPLGIPGAPSSLPAPSALLDGSWQLCSDAAADGPGITLTFGAAPYLSPASGEAVVLDDGQQRWLVHDGHRTPASSTSTAPVIVTIPEIAEALPLAPAGSTGSDLRAGSPGTIACVQSDPAAPFARPSVAAVVRSRSSDGVVIEGIRGRVRLVIPRGAGVVARQPDGEGYWLLTSSGELAPVADDRALTQLGYHPASSVRIPVDLTALLPAGPELSVQAAADG